MRHIAGANGPVRTSKSTRSAAKRDCTVVVEGPYAALEPLVPIQGDGSEDCSFCPEGMYVESAALDPDGTGGGKLSIMCLAIGNDSQQNPATPTRITYGIEMVETQYELKDHPKLEAGRAEILKWLATDESLRTVGQAYRYMDADGELKAVVSAAGKKFCAAYMHGIQHFVRYYPVITKTSYYRRLPGLVIDGLSVTGGTVAFAQGTGKFQNPGIQLTGFSSTGWFKSDMGAQQAGDLMWTLTERWTWTPDGSDSEYAWIYDDNDIANT